MTKYKLTEGGVQNIKTTAFIPNDENNNDWIEYQNWLKGLDLEGEDLETGSNTPDPQFTEEELAAQIQLEQDIIDEEKIQNEIKRIAIKNLKATGELSIDYGEE
jgi:hypothetical protein